VTRRIFPQQEIHGFRIYLPYLTKLGHHGMVAHRSGTSTGGSGGTGLSSSTCGRNTTGTSLLLH
jgi:hypothetical protein